eukprot:TRINITY_DN7891_c0_g1_i1.p1 TRINITY_DN7891_c0_g1~~TRINITY_DN7891_c0_g1_i1.p1  ORF type:complete len:372 (-),score=84.11 TRINITY_DN7891_c0_g1_i1:111-1226(-)
MFGKKKDKEKEKEKKKPNFFDKVSHLVSKGHTTHDTDFEALLAQFNEKKKQIDIVTSDVTGYMGSLSGLLAAQEKLSEDMKQLFPSLSNTSRLCEAQLSTIRAMGDTKSNTLDPLILDHFQEPIKTFLVQYREISDRIHERARRQSNMDKLITKVERFTKEESPKLEATENKLVTAKRAYEDMNEELKRDIPLLLEDSVNFFLPILQNLIYTQSVFWSALGQHATELATSQSIYGPAQCQANEVITPKSETAAHKTYIESHNPWGDQSANDPYAQPNDPYAKTNDPYAQPNDPYAQPNDPYAQPTRTPPPPPRPSSHPKARGMWAFTAEGPNELSFNAGDIIEILEQNGEWWKGTLNGKTGLFPANYVSLV